MKKYIFFIIMILLSGCVIENNDILLEKNNNAIHNIIQQIPQIQNKTIIVTTISNINNLDKTSKIARVITEQIINDLTKNHIKVIEIRMRKNNIIKVKAKSGEFILTRNTLELAKIRKADAVLVGTYTTYGNKLYVSIRIVNPKTNIIIGSSDYTLNLQNLQKPYDPFSNLPTE